MGPLAGNTGDVRKSSLRLLKRWYHIPVLLGIMVFMLWSRLQSYGNFVVNNEVYFRGNDPWYHLRETSYLLENWPNTISFDIWTGFPVGRSAGQFGTLWDHIMAVSVWIARPLMGSTEEVMLVMAPIVGSLVAIPTYLIARRFVSRVAALAGVAVLALLPGTFFSYSLVGFPDHTVAEVFFQSVTIFGFLTAFAIAEREKPVWELFVDQDWEALRSPLAYATAAGVALGLYMWTWQPGVLMVGFTGVFLAIKITSDVYHGTTPEPIAVVGTVSMTVAGGMQIIPLNDFSFGVTSYSLIQVILPLSVAVGAVFLAWLARQWESQEIEPELYPLTVGGLILGAAGVVAVAIPSLWSTLTGNLLRFIGFSASAGQRTIGEGQPPLQGSSFADFVIAEYGLAFFAALVAILLIIARPLYRSDDATHTLYIPVALAVIGSIYAVPQFYDAIGGLVGVSWQVIGVTVAAGFLIGATFLVEYDAERLYLVVWAAFIGSAAFTQTRFNYYLAVIVAVGAAYFLQTSVRTLRLRSIDDLRDIKGWQAMGVAVVIAILIVPLVATAAPVWAVGANTGPGSVVQWDDSLQWMNDETPNPGELAGVDNPLAFNGTYERPANDDFEYPEGAYGVQSWWDYGHWITTRAERIPNANPFQQGSTSAANYLLAPTEQQGNEILDERGGVTEQTRYVMVDWKMVTPGSKLSAPAVFYDDGNLSASDLRSVMYQETQEGGVQAGYFARNQRYHESMMVRLYHHHGSASDPEPVVMEWRNEQLQRRDGSSFEAKILAGDDGIRTFGNMTAAREYAAERNEAPGIGAQIGGIGQTPSERVPALQQYRLVHSSESTAVSDRQYLRTFRGQARLAQQNNISLGSVYPTDPDYVKTFEKVPGATVRGSGAAPGEEVRAAVQMERPGSTLQEGNDTATFQYVQYAQADENGEFELTVPYSTEGYSEYGPENGYTNVSVRATGNYTVVGNRRVSSEGNIVASVGQFDVHEGQVNGDDPETVTVELDERTLLGGDQSGEDTSNDDDEALTEDQFPDDTTDSVTARDEILGSDTGADTADKITLAGSSNKLARIAVTGE